MSKQYKAIQPVGGWQKGGIIGDLPDAEIQRLLAIGAIKEHQPVETKTENKPMAKAEGVKK